MPQAIDETITFDPSAPFDAALYFKTLFDWGMEPCVRESDEGLSMSQLVDGPEERYALFRWANDTDPDGALRTAYARDAWDNRPAGELIVWLGL